MWPNPQETTDLLNKFTEEIFNGKLYFLCHYYSHPCDLIFWLVTIYAFFIFFFLSLWESNGHDVSVSWHLLFSLPMTVMSRLLCSNNLSVCMGKSHRILQSSGSIKPFLWLHYHVSLVYTPPLLVSGILQQCVLLFHLLSHTINIMEAHLLQIQFIWCFFLDNACSCVKKNWYLLPFFKYPFFNQQPHDFLSFTSSITFLNCPCSVFPWNFA